MSRILTFVILCLSTLTTRRVASQDDLAGSFFSGKFFVLSLQNSLSILFQSILLLSTRHRSLSLSHSLSCLTLNAAMCVYM